MTQERYSQIEYGRIETFRFVTSVASSVNCRFACLVGKPAPDARRNTSPDATDRWGYDPVHEYRRKTIIFKSRSVGKSTFVGVSMAEARRYGDHSTPPFVKSLLAIAGGCRG